VLVYQATFVLCTVLKWRVAIVAKSMAPMAKSAKVWPFPYILQFIKFLSVLEQRWL
jgi:hypothetical protein